MVTDAIVVPSLKGKKGERKKGVAGREEAAAGAGFGGATGRRLRAGRRRRRPGMAGEVWRVAVESPSGRSGATRRELLFVSLHLVLNLIS